MGNYRVNGPVTYLEGRKVVVYTKATPFAKIDDATAAELGDKVSKIGEPDDTSESPKSEESKTDESQPTRTAEQSKAEGARRAKQS